MNQIWNHNHYWLPELHFLVSRTMLILNPMIFSPIYLFIYLFICLIFHSVLRTLYYFSFIFSNIIISIFSLEKSNENKIFFIRIKRPSWSISVFSGIYNKAYKKHANLPHSFGKLGGNIYAQLLWLTITLPFTCWKRKYWSKFWWMIKTSKILWTRWQVLKWHSCAMVFSF